MEPNTNEVKQVCTIRLAFPIENDESAISYKKKIGEILADLPDVQIQFSLMTNPAMPNMPIR